MQIPHPAAGWLTAEEVEESDSCGLSYHAQSAYKQRKGKRKKAIREMAFFAQGSVNYYHLAKVQGDGGILMMYVTPLSSSRSGSSYSL